MKHVEQFFLESPWVAQTEAVLKPITQTLHGGRWGKQPLWQQSLDSLPSVPQNLDFDLHRDCLRIGKAEDFGAQAKQTLEKTLKEFCPWRKGPFELFGVHIDTEWRSDWKWQRLSEHIEPLAGRKVLDIGAGSGYHCWRMLAEGASWVLGLEPMMLSVYQFLSVQRYVQQNQVAVVPLRLEQLPRAVRDFDTVFSMGVFYHARSVSDHLQRLKQCLRPGGQLVLEGLVLPDSGLKVLKPRKRYAQMRNVWAIPTVDQMTLWLSETGFEDVRCVHQDYTSLDEQRSTEWMPFLSLKDFLDPEDSSRTVEGYPAPYRAIFLAKIGDGVH